MTLSNPQNIDQFKRSLEKSMSVTTTGLCTLDTDHRDSETSNWRKVTKEDWQFFQGHVIETWNKTSATTEELLREIGADWSVVGSSHEHLHNGELLVTEKVVHWHQSNNGLYLSTFTDKRKPAQPVDVVNNFRQYCSSVGLSMDVLGYLPNEKRLYCASKLVQINKPMVHVGDETDHWLFITCDYGQAKAMRVFVFHNELVCTNGMVQKIVEKNHILSHRKTRTYDEFQALLSRAVTKCERYEDIKDQLINKKLSHTEARNVIRRFFRDTQGLEDVNEPSKMKTVNQIEYLNEYSLKGGHLPSRQGNAFRLLQAVTEYTSHHRRTKSDDYRFSQKLGGDLGRLDVRAHDFIAEAVGVS